MSNEKKPSDPETPNVKTKLPQIDENSVEEIPAGDLDGLAGGIFDSCDCSKACTNTGVSKGTTKLF
ncbi:MAG: hypothetical protein PVSMB1_06040 [Gemmatimonadaceae bacterium]